MRKKFELFLWVSLLYFKFLVLIVYQDTCTIQKLFILQARLKNSPRGNSLNLNEKLYTWTFDFHENIQSQETKRVQYHRLLQI